MPMPILPRPNQTECAAVVWDWDGTLADSQSANLRALAYAVKAHGVVLDPVWYGQRLGTSVADLLAELAVVHRRELPVAQVINACQEYILADITSLVLIPQTRAVLEELHGAVPMAIASGGARRVVEAGMAALKVRHLFDAVVCRDDVPLGKPAPDLFLSAAAWLGVEPARCWAYEDADEGIASARAANMHVVDVRPYIAPAALRLTD
ncbi:HAD family phosphatase [Microbispora sp. NBRC 16548]|uniref:HAD family hydrolase n=1 Tax=Microbispora sp. NBRC 16548 TaxID=3030994 RepID=UPI0024A40C19|nr:HAD family phosphatase [Microbispora sp. NBRC 16548]GLX06606.1 haloacid dehalogenase [Microbispora sp. NBRC 16548]